MTDYPEPVWADLRVRPGYRGLHIQGRHTGLPLQIQKLKNLKTYKLKTYKVAANFRNGRRNLRLSSSGWGDGSADCQPEGLIPAVLLEFAGMNTLS